MKNIVVLSTFSFFAFCFSYKKTNAQTAQHILLAPICVKRYKEVIDKPYEYYQGTIEYRACTKGDRTKNYLTNNIFMYDDGDVIWVKAPGNTWGTYKIHKDLITKFKVKQP